MNMDESELLEVHSHIFTITIILNILSNFESNL